MKKYILLIIAAIFCLPNISFAQDRGWRSDPWSRLSSPTAESMWLKTSPSLADVKRKIYQNNPKSSNPYRVKRAKISFDPVKYVKPIEEVIDKTTGIVTLRWSDGTSYVGETYRTTLHGTGTMIYPDNSKYYGGWKYSYRDGVGTMEYADGSKYIGQWVRDIPNGDGTLITPEGTAFSGKFKDGVPHGKCIMQSPDGKLYKARWHYGKLRKRSVKPLEEK